MHPLHRIIIDDEEHFREYYKDKIAECYGEQLNKEVIWQQILDEFVVDEIRISTEEVKTTLQKLEGSEEGKVLAAYIRYLELLRD